MSLQNRVYTFTTFYAAGPVGSRVTRIPEHLEDTIRVCGVFRARVSCVKYSGTSSDKHTRTAYEVAVNSRMWTLFCELLSPKNNLYSQDYD